MIEDAKYLSENEKTALSEIKKRIQECVRVTSFILFGSKARGHASETSDIDLLIITDRELTGSERHHISDILFDVNIEYGTLFSFITEDRKNWNSELYRFLPIHINVEREGISV